jgi:hypothetical protein
MAMQYDPDQGPDPKQWLETGEGQRISLVEKYHRKQRIGMPSLKAHAALHVMVENQVAMGDELTVKATLERLMREGLDRHDAVHAIATVLTDWIWAAENGQAPKGDPNAYYRQKLKELTAEKWRSLADESDDEE